MRYISTRGGGDAQRFEDVLLTGLAPDGGLYVPESLPTVSAQTLEAWARLDYPSLATEIIEPFIGGWLPREDLAAIVAASYSGFRHDAVAPLMQLSRHVWVQELFHGPTLAFKDFALQLLGRLVDRALEERDLHAVVLGATSGDTGSAAIEGCRHCRNADVFILHPHQRVSDVQRRQMTTVLADNVHNLAVEGNFDDCQEIVKASFADQSFLPAGHQLVAVNSINWARIMAQIVYYFYAGLTLGAPHRRVSFAVPTGNFGDIYAGFLAKRMGLPVDRLIIATNANDILHRFISRNRYERTELLHTLSPSMDIVVSSNFERALFDAYGGDAAAVADLMGRFRREAVTVPDAVFGELRRHFDSAAVDDSGTCATIAEVFEGCGYLLDPHSAIAVRAALDAPAAQAAPVVALATAHPAKFPEAVIRSGQSHEPALPAHLADLFQREERYRVVARDRLAVQGAVCDALASG